jgi:peptidoglycan/LPS O-acetylase OafA/YrhL
MLLLQLLQTKNNNLNLFRSIAALLVIYGHSPAFLPNQQSNDIIYNVLKFDYSGSLAVKFFFMLSGLLVTQSLLSYPATKPFLIKRAVRIFPGLIVCLLITVFVVGLLFTSLGAIDYLLHPQIWNYLFHNTLLIFLQWELPGVFEGAGTSTVNGSLWTLPLEVLCYFCLLIFYATLIRYNKTIASILLLIPIGGIFFGEFFWPNYLFRVKEALLLGGCFCLGVFVALYQQQIVINAKGVVVGVAALLLLWFSPLQILCFYVVLFYVCLYLSSTRVFNRYLKIPGDPSYGIYIYGFVIQHLVAGCFPDHSLMFNQLVAALTAVLVGYLSWYLIEKPSMTWGKNFMLKNNERV